MPNGEVEGPAEASGRTQVERSSSGALHAAGQGAEGAQSPSARGANPEAHHGPLQRLLDRVLTKARLIGHYVVQQLDERVSVGTSIAGPGDAVNSYIDLIALKAE
jgi:hypothetical protein